ncbi:hypothetical protein, partial [Rhizobium leguminosarum]|uniref:hypothetical protein n=1 Tax=Rhizobium leguminosarum TaxID=384 RepID=UPI003F98DC92
SLSTMKEGGNANRAAADDLLKNMLQDNAMALGVWTGWEPNAFVIWDQGDAAVSQRSSHRHASLPPPCLG